MDHKTFTASELETAIAVLSEMRHVSTQNSIAASVGINSASCVDLATDGLIKHLEDLIEDMNYI